jgi:hypothetical protein
MTDSSRFFMGWSLAGAWFFADWRVADDHPALSGQGGVFANTQVPTIAAPCCFSKAAATSSVAPVVMTSSISSRC